MTERTDRDGRLRNLSPAKKAQLIAELRKSAEQKMRRQAIPRQDRRGPMALSFAQQRLWFLEQLRPGNIAYNNAQGVRLVGRLDRSALERTLNEIARRHESLRTTFALVDEQSVQIIAPALTLPLSIKDLTEHSPLERQAAAERIIDEEATRPFNLTQGPLIRTTLLRLDERDHILLLTLHHIISDGWSMWALIREMEPLYRAYLYGKPAPLEELPIQYADFALWQREWLRGENLAQQLAYWKDRLESAPPLNLPTDRPRPAFKTFRGERQPVEVRRATTRALARLSEQENASLFMTLLAALNVLLSRYTRQQDIVVGAAIANRNRVEVENLIGFFVNALVIRTHLDGKRTFRELLRSVRDDALRSYAYQDLPLELLVEELQPERDLSGNPIFQVMFALHNSRMSRLSLEGLESSTIEINNRTSKFDLEWSLVESPDSISGFIEYSLDLFNPETMARMAGHFRTLLDSIAANPDQKLEELSLIDTSERETILWEWNDGGRDYRKRASLIGLFETRVESAPDATALKFGQEEVSYGELNNRANRVGDYLRSLGVGPDMLVGLCLERGVEMIVGMLGILKAGGAYLPIDPSSPQERIDFILEDAQVEVLLTSYDLIERWPAYTGRPVYLDADWPLIARSHEVHPRCEIDPDNLAYVIYTSGSTGRPKGTFVSHYNVVRLFEATRRRFEFNDRDVWTMFHSYAFDFSVWEIWGALLYGGTVVMTSYEVSRSPEAFYEMLIEERVTVLNQTPSAFGQLMRVDEQAGRSREQSLKTVIFGGEALELQSLKGWIDRHGDERPRLINMYGITETTVHVTYRRIIREDIEEGKGSRIGRPLEDLRVYLLDEGRGLVPAGAPGEMYVGGAGVSRGYLKRADLTAERFAPDPISGKPGSVLYRTGDLARYGAGGDLEYLGRVDQQVKIRGFRVELGEIESALARHPAVHEAVVMLREDQPGDKRLVAYLTQTCSPTGAGRDGAAPEWTAESVSQWQAVFDETYGRPPAGDDPRFNIVGWNSSYTGAPLDAEEMAEWVDQTIDRLSRLAPDRVLEIGCGVGLLLFRLAPQCSLYVGRDLSPRALQFVRRHLSFSPQPLPQVSLDHGPADDFDGLAAGSFDTVILNSVVQYFPGVDYLLSVLKGAADVVRDGGSIFIGDVRSLPLLNAFHASVQLEQAPASLSRAQLIERIRSQQVQEGELIIAPEFFFALKSVIGRIGAVEVQLKQGRRQNELTRFRYDVVLHLGHPGHQGPQPAALTCARWLDWRQESLTPAGVRETLEELRPEALGLIRAPNARLAPEMKLLEILADAGGPQSVGAIRQALNGAAPAALDPSEMWALGESLSYRVDIAWSATGGDGDLDVLFTRRTAGAEETERRAAPSFPRAETAFRPLSSYANDPLKQARARRLAPELRLFMQERLPEYMAPSAYVVLDSLPLTANGKVDRRALPAPDSTRPEMETDFAQPQSPVEGQVVRIWSEILGIDRIGRHDNFFELGGHSLLATQVISRIREKFRIQVQLSALFEGPTAAELAVVIESSVQSGRKASHPPLARAARDADPPLSFAQQRLWIVDQIEPGNPAYNNSDGMLLAGELNLPAFGQTINQIVARHEVLRTTFAAPGGRPAQVIAPSLPLTIPLVDLSQLPEEMRLPLARTLAAEEARRAFNLAAGPLLRVMLLRLGGQEHVVLFTIHHIISDFWSLSILLREITTLYQDLCRHRRSSLPDLPLQYADFSQWQLQYLQGEILETQLAYWKDRLAGAPPLLKLPIDRPRPAVQTYRGAREPFFLPGALTAAFKELSRQEDATLFMILMAAFKTLLHRYSGQEDIVVGSVIANRNHPGTEGLVGFFVNTLVLRTNLSGEVSFRELLRREREVALGAYAHQDLPFEKLVEVLKPGRDLSHQPLFQAVLALQNAPKAELKLEGLTVVPLSPEVTTSKFDLVFNIWEAGEGLTGSMEYNVDLFEPATVARMLTHYEKLIASIIAHPDDPIERLEIMSDAERALLEQPIVIEELGQSFSF